MMTTSITIKTVMALQFQLMAKDGTNRYFKYD